MSEQQGSQYPLDHHDPAQAAERVGLIRALYERSLLTWKLLWDRRVGFLPKLIPLLAVVYLVSPIDLVPAVALGPLAPLGTLDDVGIMLLALNLFVQAAPPDVVREYLRELGSKRISHDEADVIEGQAKVVDE